MKKPRKILSLLSDDPEIAALLRSKELDTLIPAPAQDMSTMLLGLKAVFQGDKGDTPEAGVDYFTEQEKQAFIKAATPEKFKDYFTDEEVSWMMTQIRESMVAALRGGLKAELTPQKGIDYNDGRDGEDAVVNEKAIIEGVLKQMPAVKDVNVEDIAKSVLEKIKDSLPNTDAIVKEIKAKKLIELRDIKGARLDSPSRGSNGFNMNDQRWHGGGSSGGSGTVTTVSVVTANGFAGTVTNATTTPAITVTTTITGILKGNGTAISAAVAGDVDLILPTQTGNSGKFLTTNGTTSSWASVSGSGTVTNVASADGSITITNPTTTVDLAVVKAPKWSTARSLAGNSVDGSANVAFANKFIVQGTTDAGLSGAQFLGALTTGIVKNTTTTGVLSIAVAGTDYQAPITLTTTGSSGAATFVGNTLNIPQYSGGSGDMLLAGVQTVTGAKTFNAGTLLDKGEIVFDVKAYGAVGNDTADDTTAIQSTIDACNTAGGGTVFFPKGTYKISAALQIYSGTTPTIVAYKNIRFLGSGSSGTNGTILKQYTTSADCIKGLNDVANGAQALNIAFENFSMAWGTATLTNSGNGIYLKQQAASGPSFQNFSFKGVLAANFQGSGKYGFNFESMIASTVETCQAVTCANGFFLNGAVTTNYSSVSTSVSFINCFANMATNGVNGYRCTDNTYISYVGCAADYGANSTGSAYLVEGSASVSFTACGCELNGTATLTNMWKVAQDASSNPSSGVGIYNCYSFQSKSSIDVYVTGSSNATLIGHQDNSSVSGSTGLKVDAGSSATESDSSWGAVATPRTIATGAFNFILSDKAGNQTVPVGTIYNGSTSGTIKVIATATAGSNTLTLPAATDTLIGKATTDTLTNKTLTTPVINGISTGTGVATAATVSTLILRDTNGNASVVNVLEGFTSTTTAAGTTTLTVASNYQQFFTGTTTQTVTLPVATTLVNGQSWLFVNNSTGLVTVQTSGSNALIILAAGTSAYVTCINTAGGTGTASWNVAYYADVISSGKKLTVTQSLTLAGTDATTMTFPSTSKTIAANDGSNWTFGSQAIGDIVTASSTTAYTRIAAVAVGAVLTAAGTGTQPTWSTAPQITTIELGAATDTTLARVSAGIISVEGVTVATSSNTLTFTNKRITKRVTALSANSAAPAINTDNFDVCHITAQTATITGFTMTGTPVDGDTLRISITGTASVPFTLGTLFEASTVPLSTTTSGTTRLDMGFLWNSETSKWRQVAAA